MRWKLGLRLGNLLDRQRLRLAHPNALPQMSLMGLATGIAAGAVIVLFRWAVEGAQAAFLAGGEPEAYESLPVWLRLVLPLLGGAAIGWLFHRFSGGLHLLGVARVLERISYHQGYLTLRGFFLQFAGAALALVSGHSVGREGPHVYLGAASGSLLGQQLGLPNNSIRTLVGCGAAAGIAASFNTPLAGVIFALEVVMMEYTLASFIPVMLAAVAANMLSVTVFGNQPAFSVPAMHPGPLAEIPLVMLLGVLAGALSALFIHLLQLLSSKVRGWPFWWRTTLAGFLVGVLAMVEPQVMGIGYDSVNAALLGGIGWSVLALLLLFKLLATTASVGMGIPGGMIGPALFMGAVLGSLFAQSANLLMPAMYFDVGFYALLGMGAMMGASLQAPLAALVAVFELTYSPQIIMPGMLAVVIAGLTASEVFGKESLFITMLKAAGMDYRVDPLTQALRRIGVASVMQRSFVRAERLLAPEGIDGLLHEKPEWLLIYEGAKPLALMRAVALVRYLQDEGEGDQAVDLLEIPGERDEVVGIDLQANLQQALERLDQAQVNALYVERTIAPGFQRIYGVLTRATVESAYQY